MSQPGVVVASLLDPRLLHGTPFGVLRTADHDLVPLPFGVLRTADHDLVPLPVGVPCNSA